MPTETRPQRYGLLRAGVMLAVGAVPRIVGPWWSLYSLNLACEIEHMECWKGGRTWLEFFTDGGNTHVSGSGIEIVALRCIWAELDSG